jgi:hypothetical protein
MNYTRYFVINLVIEGFYNWLPERKLVARLSYVILEEKADILDGNFSYIYTGMRFEGALIKKLLNAEGVIKLITSTYIRSHDISRCVINKPSTNEEVLSMVMDSVKHELILLTSTKSNIYSYNI